MISDEYGYEVTPLGLSVYTHGQKVLVRALLEGGADPNIEDKYICTPLHEAVKKGYREVVNMLLDFGADINKEGGRRKETPLHMAAGNYFGDPETVELLINRGAEINATSSKNGWTAYDVANEQYDLNERYDWHQRPEGRRNHCETLSLLRKHGGLSRYDLPSSPHYIESREVRQLRRDVDTLRR